MSKRTDIWAAGVVFYELATGQRPFGGATKLDLINEIQSADPIAPRKLNDRISTKLEALILRCLSRVPERRPASGKDLAQSLRHLDLTAYDGVQAGRTDWRGVWTAVAGVVWGAIKGGFTAATRGWSSAQSRRAALVSSLSAALILGLVTGVGLLRSVRPPQPDSARNFQLNGRSISIYPFRNRGPTEEWDYVGVGLADVLAAELTNSGLFEVRLPAAAWTLGDDTDYLSDAKSAGVDAVLTGTYSIEDGSLSLSYTMVDVDSGVNLKGDLIEISFNQVIEAEHRVALGIMAALGEGSRAEAIGIGSQLTEQNDAFNAYLRSKYQLELFWRDPSMTGLADVRRSLEQARDRDPAFTLALVRLSVVNWMGSFWGYIDGSDTLDRAYQAAQEAIGVDPAFGEAYAARSLVHFQLGQLPEMRRDIARAFESTRFSALAYYAAGWYYIAIGLADFSVGAFSRAEELDPELVRRELGIAYRFQADFIRAEQQFRADLVANSGDVPTEVNLAGALLALGQTDEAIRRSRELMARSPDDPAVQSLSALAAARTGSFFDFEAWISEFGPVYETDPGYCLSVAGVFAVKGDADLALSWLDRARDLGVGAYPYLERYPFFDGLRGDARFQEQLTSLREEWESNRFYERENPLLPAG